MCLVGERFSYRRTVSKLLTPEVHRSYLKISFFGEKLPLNGKNSKFRCFLYIVLYVSTILVIKDEYKRIYKRIWIHVFLPGFAKLGIAEATKHGIRQEKKLVFCPFLCGF